MSEFPNVTFVKGPEAPTIVDMSSWQRPLDQSYSLDRSNWRAIQFADYENAEAEALRFFKHSSSDGLSTRFFSIS